MWYIRMVMTEKELISGVIAGNKQATERFCKQYRARLFGFIATKVENFLDVEEIAQDSLLSAIDSLPTFKGESGLFTWMGSIARHEIGDFYRKKKIKQVVFSRLPFLENLVSQALGPELAYQELETKRRILKSLKKLSEGYGQILRLKYVDELSMKQIARKLNLTVKAVESRLTRARLAFQAVYVKEDSEDWHFTDNQGIIPFD